MQILRLSIANFKRNIRFYLSYILSLSFSAFILYDFLALMDSGLLEIMGKKNQEFSDMILVSMIVVLLFFVFCFLWYATNVFLNLRKKEMGTFIFMGLDQKEISRMYTLEMLLAALSAVLTGIGAGVVFFKLFAMLFFQLSGMEADISMQFSFVSALQCAAAFLILYLLLAIKGYFSIIKTSIRDMLEATRQREVVRATGLRALLSSLLFSILLIGGYFCAMQIGEMDSFSYMLLAVVLVIAGVYGLYRSLFPYLLQQLSIKKGFLYRKQRTLWINNLVFRVKKNYRTYAIVTIMMLCSVSALNAGLAFKQRYDAMAAGEGQFSYILLSTQPIPTEDLNKAAAAFGNMEYQAVLQGFPYTYEDENHLIYTDMVLSYTDYETYCKSIHKQVFAREPKPGNGLCLSKKYLISMADEVEDIVPFPRRSIHIQEKSEEYYFGIMQNNMNFIILNDEDYQAVINEKTQYMHMQMVQMDTAVDIKELRKTLAPLCDEQISAMGVDPENDDLAFVRVMYAACVFMFLVFVVSCGGVIFMKTCNDADDDYGRCQILKNIGISKQDMKKAIHRELGFTYIMPLLLTAISSVFIIHAIERVMRTKTLLPINLLTLAVVFLFDLMLYLISVQMYEKSCGLADEKQR